MLMALYRVPLFSFSIPSDIWITHTQLRRPVTACTHQSLLMVLKAPRLLLAEEACDFLTKNIRIPVLRGEWDGDTKVMGSAIVGGKL